jgi:trypsin
MRGGMPRRFACLLGTLAALCCAAPASAASPRIIGGHTASPGEYPAQGVLQRNGFFTCGGTLISNRYFLTAAHCVTNESNGALLPLNQFSVRLGSVNRSAGQVFTFSTLTRNADYDFQTLENDSALFTLSTPATGLTPLRLIDEDETSLWSTGRSATLIGWGLTEDGNNNSDSEILLEATAPMRSDEDCADAYGTDFDPGTMVCAGDGATDTCNGDSGGPMMVSDGSFMVLAGLTSWGGPCGSETQPGVYTRLGAPTLNQWVRARVPMARATVSDAAPDPGEEVTFSVTTTHPSIPDFTTFAWDFDSDGEPDATGIDPTVTHTYPADADVVARVTASGSGVNTATDKVALRVGDPTPTPEPTPTREPTPTPEPTSAPSDPAPRPDPAAAQPLPVPAAAASGPLATILVSGRPRVRHGRFAIRVRFASTAPAKTAVIEVIRNRRVIGIARTKVLQGGTKRLRVKLTPRGRRLLSRSRTHRLKLAVRVRVGRQVLRSKHLTIRR